MSLEKGEKEAKETLGMISSKTPRMTPCVLQHFAQCCPDEHRPLFIGRTGEKSRTQGWNSKCSLKLVRLMLNPIILWIFDLEGEPMTYLWA